MIDKPNSPEHLKDLINLKQKCEYCNIPVKMKNLKLHDI